ncbi:MAG: hypothetical protein R2854_20160 [Caldilineaceae bacterium]
MNRARFAQLYGEEAASRLMAKLDELAADDGVRGEIIRLDRNQQVNQAYANWTGNETNYKSVERANLVTNEIRKVIMTYLSGGGVKFLVLVGDDRVLPFRRIRTTRRSSRKRPTNWSATIIPQAALRANYFLSDDFTRPRDRLPTRPPDSTCPTSPRAVCWNSRRHHRHD